MVLFLIRFYFILFLFFFFRPFTEEQAKALKQPNTLKTFHKKLFSFFHRKGVIYSFTKDFNEPGGFHAWHTEVYGLGQQFRPDLGNKPNQAAVDPDAEAKIRTFGKYDPYNNHNDCLKLLIRQTMKYGALRGSLEVSSLFYFYFLFSIDLPFCFFLLSFQPHMMRRQDFNSGIEEHGEFQGRRYVEILPNTKNTKTHRLNLINETFDC